ncbi:MAG: hypothetical protein ACREBA_08790 [Nitrosotalea sp.]
MEKDLHTETHRLSPEEILKEKILSARQNQSAVSPANSKEIEEIRDEPPSGLPVNKTWFQRNEYVIIGLIVLIVIVAGCILLNALAS